MNQIAEANKFLLDFVDLIFRQTHRRENRHARFITILPNNDIATAQVFKVIGKGTERSQNRIRVPAGLKFNTFTFHLTLVKEVVEVDGEFGGHGLSGLIRTSDKGELAMSAFTLNFQLATIN